MIRNILVAVDIKDESDAFSVIEKGKALAELYEAKLTVLHVLDFPLMEDILVPGLHTVDEEYFENAKVRLSAMVKEVGLSPLSFHLVAGSAAKQILSYANKNKVDLIVLGNHEKGAVNSVLGSVANSVLHRVKCDVYVLHL